MGPRKNKLPPSIRQILYDILFHLRYPQFSVYAVDMLYLEGAGLTLAWHARILDATRAPPRPQNQS